MKKILTIEIEFDSWFEPEKEPKTNEEWQEFFSNSFLPECSVLGFESDDGTQEQIAINSMEIIDIK